MQCPKCMHEEDKVVDSRTARNGLAIRRRRQCQGCGHRFTTIEQLLPVEIFVIKQDKSREEFSVDKLRRGIEKACYKLEVNEEVIDELVGHVVQRVEASGRTEITAEEVGNLVMQELRDFNDVAYVRFASVYREFTDTEQFIEEIRELGKKRK